MGQNNVSFLGQNNVSFLGQKVSQFWDKKCPNSGTKSVPNYSRLISFLEILSQNWDTLKYNMTVSILGQNNVSFLGQKTCLISGTKNMSHFYINVFFLNVFLKIIHLIFFPNNRFDSFSNNWFNSFQIIGLIVFS